MYVTLKIQHGASQYRGTVATQADGRVVVHSVSRYQAPYETRQAFGCVRRMTLGGVWMRVRKPGAALQAAFIAAAKGART